MEAALPFLAHLAFLGVALGSFLLGILLLTRRSGVWQYLAGPALLLVGVWCLYRAITRF